MRFVAAANERTLTVREAGDPAGVPVLVHAGTPGSSVLYEPTIRDAEERGIRLFSYDRPGYGGSTRDEGRDIAACAADVEAVCDALGIDRFCVWGVSGGGPHALATAALLPDRVAAAAALAPVAPFGAAGLDFFEGMGEKNIEEFGIIFDGEDAHRAALERDRAELLAASPEQLVDAWRTLLGPADAEVLTGRFAAFVLESVRAGIEKTLNGWLDDDVAFTRSWGFDLGAIRVPVLHWQGEQDKFVPFGHGVWLSEHIPGVESHLSPDDGHLTLVERHLPEVHTWLVERY
jgi:pimeloyl-ACP methyl ester carboxylesterase